MVSRMSERKEGLAGPLPHHASDNCRKEHLSGLDDGRLRSPEELAHPTLFVLSRHRRRLKGRVHGTCTTTVVTCGPFFDEAHQVDAVYPRTTTGGVKPGVQRTLLVFVTPGGKGGGNDWLMVF